MRETEACVCSFGDGPGRRETLDVGEMSLNGGQMPHSRAGGVPMQGACEMGQGALKTSMNSCTFSDCSNFLREIGSKMIC